jgi:hypothetical protein
MGVPLRAGFGPEMAPPPPPFQCGRSRRGARLARRSGTGSAHARKSKGWVAEVIWSGFGPEECAPGGALPGPNRATQRFWAPDVSFRRRAPSAETQFRCSPSVSMSHPDSMYESPRRRLQGRPWQGRWGLVELWILAARFLGPRATGARAGKTNIGRAAPP